jgi:hypothetical protein
MFGERHLDLPWTYVVATPPSSLDGADTLVIDDDVSTRIVLERPMH